MISVDEIPKGWLLVEWSRPLRECSECHTAGHSEGWRQEQNRNYFLCAECGPAKIKHTRKPREEKPEVSRDPVPEPGPKRRGRPVGSKNRVKRK